MCKKNFKYILLSFSLCLSCVAAYADSLGLGASWSNSPYKGYGGQLEPLPQIDLDNGRFFIDDLSIGAYLLKTDKQEITLDISYLPQQFKPTDTNNAKLKKLDKRHPTAIAELGYSLNTSVGNLSASIGGDVLNNSNSVIMDVSYNIAFSKNNWTVLQSIGLGWANSNHNDYYYGISQQEAKRSDLPAYQANSSFTPYASVTGSYKITKHINGLAGIRIDKLTGDVKNSPMTEHSVIPSAFAGINYQF
ncbi:MAG: MipA/OmpV family protein [Snodgrassella sp.]|nr:MipA/OmpV family protein [Snodgrassella sp.]